MPATGVVFALDSSQRRLLEEARIDCVLAHVHRSDLAGVPSSMRYSNSSTSLAPASVASRLSGARPWWVVIAALVIGGACAAGRAAPLDPVMGDHACAHCRMTIVSRATAAQIARSGDEPVFFDDLGCLRDYLLHQRAPADAVIYVADHRSGAWVDARAALKSPERINP